MFSSCTFLCRNIKSGTNKRAHAHVLRRTGDHDKVSEVTSHPPTHRVSHSKNLLKALEHMI